MATSGTSVSVELRSGRLATEETSGPVRVLFVGERPSPLAARRNWRWEDGRLCAGTLLRAVRAAGLDPEQFRFVNLWVTPGLGPTQEAPHLEPVIQAHRQGSTIIALGRLIGDDR